MLMNPTASLGAAPGATRAPERGRLGLVLAGAATTLMMAGASAPSPFYPVLQERLGLGALGVSVAFAVYALALLLALLSVGSISDHVGRRPVLAAGFVALAVGVLLIWTADAAWALLLGRIVQGAASGALLSTASALVIDFAPPARPRLGALVNALAPMVGLALGTFVAGVLLQVAPDAAATATFAPLVAAYVAVALLVWAVPETSPRRPGWARSLRPRAAVPHAARGLFGVSIPIILAGWATGGLFLSLGPSIVHSELHVDGRLGPALVVGVLPAAGAVAAFAMRRRRPATSAVYGASALAVGTVVMLLALTVASLPLYVFAVVVAGTGFGTAFSGTVGSLTSLAAPDERAELFASIYIVSYLSFGVPAVIAGALATIIGLHATVLGYGAIVAIAAGAAAIARARWAPRAVIG
jgi:MFS family permease